MGECLASVRGIKCPHSILNFVPASSTLLYKNTHIPRHYTSPHTHTCVQAWFKHTTTYIHTHTHKRIAHTHSHTPTLTHSRNINKNKRHRTATPFLFSLSLSVSLLLHFSFRLIYEERKRLFFDPVLMMGIYEYLFAFC